MADDNKDGGGGGLLEEFGLFIGGFLLLVALWWMQGGHSFGKGLFIAPPSPIGNGQVFGPTLNNSGAQPTTTTQTQPTQ